MAMQIGGGVTFTGGAYAASWTPYVAPPTYGALYTWGQNSVGALGDGTTTDRSSPVSVIGGGTTWSQVAGGIGQTAAVKTDGTLWTWGQNAFGGLGTGSTANRSSPGTTAGGGTNWSQVACGAYYTAAIKTDGTLWTCGYGRYGNLGIGTSTNCSSFITTAGGGTTWSSVSCGYLTTAAIKTDGTLWTCGYNSPGCLGNGSTANTSSFATVAGGGTTWSSIAVGRFHAAAIKTDGTLWTWGNNSKGNLGSGTTTATSSPGTVAGGGTTWQQVVVGGYHTAAIKTDGTLWTCGYGTQGQLGNGSIANTSSLGTVAGGGTTWSRTATGFFFTAAIKTDGTLWAWGYNNAGQLGNGSTTNQSSPGTVVGGGTTWRQVVAGQNNTTLAIAQ